MKKLLLAGALVATMGIGAFSVYADAPSTNEFDQRYGQHMNGNDLNRDRLNQDREIFTEEEREEWFNERQTERSTHKEERIQLALDEGWITEEEAAERRAELAERDQLYEENGFSGRRSHGGMGRGYRQNQSFHCH